MINGPEPQDFGKISEMRPQEIEDIKLQVREELPNYPWPDVEMGNLFFGDPMAEKADLFEGFLGIRLHQTDKNGERYHRDLATPTEQYLLIPHELVYHKFNQALQENNIEYGKPTVKLKFYDDGAKFEMFARFNETKVTVGKDKATPEVWIKNSVDMGWQQSAGGGAIVWRCTNGMVSGHIAFEWKKKHRQNYSIDAQVHEMLHGMESMSNQFDIWKTWTKKQISNEQCEKLFTALPISENQAKKIMELPEIGSGMRLKDRFEKGKSVTGWDVNSVVTQWLTHEVNESSGRREREEKVALIMDRFMKAA
jgi:hypothetical protein